MSKASPKSRADSPPTSLLAHPAALPALFCLLLVVITAGVYWPVARHDYVILDDPEFVYANPMVLNGLTGQGVVRAFQFGHGDYWHPMTWLSLMLDVTLFGPEPGALHLVNVGFHAANVMLVFLLLRRWTGSTWRSLAVAAFFALHPLRVESVAWITERKDVLSAFFMLLSLWAYTRYAGRSAKPEVRGSKAGDIALRTSSFALASGALDYSLALLFFALGLMSKAMVVTLPFVLLLLDYWPLGRVPGARGRGSGTGSPTVPSAVTFHVSTFGRLVVEKAPFFALSALFPLMVSQAMPAGDPSFMLADLPWRVRIETVFVSYVGYLAKTFWPATLITYYPHPFEWPAWRVIFSAGLVLGLTVGAWVLRRTRPHLFTGWFWFVGMLVPALGLTRGWFQHIADRFTYLPSIGLFLALVWGVAELAGRRRQWRWPIAAVTAVAIAACAARTRDQLGYWENSETLLRHALGSGGKSALTYEQLARYLVSRGWMDEAIATLREVQALYDSPAGRSPRMARYRAIAHLNLGSLLIAAGRVDEAAGEFRTALAIDPEYAAAYSNLGVVHARKGQLEEAVKQFQRALEIRPDRVETLDSLGCAYANQGNLEPAMAAFRKAIEINPRYVPAWLDLGRALALTGRRDEAIAAYRSALRADPYDTEAARQLRALGVSARDPGSNPP